MSASAAEPLSFHGAAALNQLKQRGLYASLPEAVQAARYTVGKQNDMPGAYYLHNPAQRLLVTFTPQGAQLQTQGAQTSLRPRSIGYGARGQRITEGVVQAVGNRVEIQRRLQTGTTNRAELGNLTEWFVNRPAGLEHGFTLNTAPGERQAGEMLRLALDITGDLRARLLADNQGLALLSQDGAEALHYAGLKVWDASGKTLAAEMKLMKQEVIFEVDDAAAAYPITIDPTFFALEAQVLAGGVAQDLFGAAVDLSGDTVVVGAADAVGPSPGSDAAFVFVRSGNVWFLQQKLDTSDALFDGFGRWVAIDGNTLAVAARGDSVMPGSAATYIFTRSGAVWTQQQKLPNTGPVALSGNTLLIGGNVYERSGATWGLRQTIPLAVSAVAFDGNTIAIGVAGEDVGSNRAQGAAYVYTRSSSGWVQQARLAAADGAAEDAFGWAVAVNLDVVVIGAPRDDSGANSNQGSAYVFARSGTTWTQQQKLEASDGLRDNNFGWAVAVAGTIIFTGAPHGAELSSAYVFVRSTTWRQLQKLTSSQPADAFGNALAVEGRTAIVGAFFPTGGEFAPQGPGSVCLLTRPGATWQVQQLLYGSDGAANDSFGEAIALAGNTLVVGAPGRDGRITGLANRGAAYVFIRVGVHWRQQSQLLPGDGGAANDSFGISVAISGDTIAVGAQRNNAPRGAVYVFVRSGGGWTQQAKLTASDSSELGFAVALEGNTLAAGGPGGTGAVYVYERSGTAWSAPQRLVAGDGSASLGGAVALSGSTVVAGRTPISGNGAAYIFIRSGSTWTQQQRLVVGEGPEFDIFGASVSLSGNTVLIGAPGKDGNQGAAYLFTRAGTVWSRQQRLIARDRAGIAFFGRAVTLGADTLVIGASLEAGKGSAYLFGSSGTTWTQQQKFTIGNVANGSQFGNAVALSGNILALGAPFDEPGRNAGQGAVYVFKPTSPLALTSAASYVLGRLARESISSAFGADLSADVHIAGQLPLPTTLGGTTVMIEDSAGVSRLAPLFFVSPTQINYQIPPNTATGTALATLTD